MRLLLGLLALALLAPVPGQEKQKEHYDNGKLKAEYSVDKDGKKHGRYTEFFESGKKKISAEYDHGDLSGDFWEYHEGGKLFGKKAFSKGKPTGDVLRMDPKGILLYRATLGKGPPHVYADLKTPEPAYDRTLEDIRKRIAGIDPPGDRLDLDEDQRFEEVPSSAKPYKAGRLKSAYLEDALKHMNAYRYLSGLSPTVKLDAGYTDHCQHAAVVVAAHGELSHDPPKPEDMDAAFFAKGHKGAASSNLHRGQGNLRSAVDGFMEDSGENNMRHVGHRAWIQNPAMSKTGFGECGGFVSLWSFDEAGRPDRPDLIAYPARGYYPVEYFAREPVWSVGPKDGKFRLPPAKDLKVRAWLLDEGFDFTQELVINHKGIRTEGGFGLGAVFRPLVPKDMAWEGQRVWVLFLKSEIPTFGYFVHFVSLKPKEPAEPESGEADK